MINKDLGLVTAYAYAVSKGYTGTEDEFAELMASYASVAEQAEESAEDSEAWAIGKRGGQDVPSTDVTYHNNSKYYADQAGTSASTAASSASAASASESNAAASASAAAGSASSATTSAATATEKAGEAATSATSASTSATSAAGSATNAASSATAASASATAAGNAQTAAETALGKAEDAQEAAEQAQSDAEAAAQSVSQSAAQISQNTSDISDLKSAFTGYKDNKEEFYDSPFKRGYLNNGSIITAINYRICSTNIITVGHPICIQATSEYKFTLAFFVNGSYTTSTDWKQFYVVDAGTSFRIQIAKYTEDTSTPADIPTFRANVTYCDADKIATTEYHFDEINWISGENILTSGSIGTSASYNRTDYVEIPSTIDGKLSYHCSATSQVASIAFYDSSKSFLSYSQAYSDPTVINIPSGTKYFRASNNPSVIAEPYIYVKKEIGLYESFAEARKNAMVIQEAIIPITNCLAEENENWG